MEERNFPMLKRKLLHLQREIFVGNFSKDSVLYNTMLTDKIQGLLDNRAIVKGPTTNEEQFLHKITETNKGHRRG